MLSVLFFLCLAAGLGLLLYGRITLAKSAGATSPDQTGAESASPDQVLPGQHSEVTNDKLVVVVGAMYGEALAATSQFVAAYPGAAIDLVRIEKGVVAAVFPADISPDWFYFFVNFVAYPTDLVYSAPVQVRGWTTLALTSPAQAGAAPEPVMVYVPADDTEHDLIRLATPAGGTYEVSFQNLRPAPRHFADAAPYTPPPFTTEELSSLNPESVAPAEG